MHGKATFVEDLRVGIVIFTSLMRKRKHAIKHKPLVPPIFSFLIFRN